MNVLSKTTKFLALSAGVILLGSCGVIGNVISGGPAISGTVATVETGQTAPAATEYRLSLVRYSFFGSTSTELESADFASPITINSGVGAFAGSLPPTISIGSDTRAYFRVVVYDDIVDDNKYDRNATNGAGAKDRLLADSANGKADGGDRYLVYVNDNQDYVTGKPLVKGWNMITDPQRDTNVSLNLGTSDDVVTQTLTGISIKY
jgi:hypothetical protein